MKSIFSTLCFSSLCFRLFRHTPQSPHFESCNVAKCTVRIVTIHTKKHESIQQCITRTLLQRKLVITLQIDFISIRFSKSLCLYPWARNFLRTSSRLTRTRRKRKIPYSLTLGTGGFSGHLGIYSVPTFRWCPRVKFHVPPHFFRTNSPRSLFSRCMNHRVRVPVTLRTTPPQ